MSQQPTVFISDIHAGPGLYPCEWLDAAGADEVCEFLYATAIQGKKIVLLGDIFDRQLCPCHLQPPTMAEVLTTGPAAQVFKALAEVVEKTSVTYVVGNHDANMAPALLPPGVIWGGDAYVDGDLRAEHGNVYTLFNANDPNVPDQVPLGYFISRMAASCEGGSCTPTSQQVITELLEMGIGKDTLPEALIDAMAAKAKLGPEDIIRMPNDLWGAQVIPLKRVRNMYWDLVLRFEKAHGILATTIAIPADKGHLGPAAAELFTMEMSGLGCIVMGHTHIPGLTKMLGRTYANSGAWSKECSPSWVEYDGKKLTLKTKGQA